MAIALAPSVAGRLHVHESRVLSVLHVADENAILDQHGLAGWRAFFVDGERAPPLADRAVIDDCYSLGGNLLAHETRKRRGFLAIEVTLEPVADGLVQHYARPSCAEHDVHFAR